jgi:hypothetical protein
MQAVEALGGRQTVSEATSSWRGKMQIEKRRSLAAAAMIVMGASGAGRGGICDSCEVAARGRDAAAGVACECRASRGVTA